MQSSPPKMFVVVDGLQVIAVVLEEILFVREALVGVEMTDELLVSGAVGNEDVVDKELVDIVVIDVVFALG